MPAKKLSLRERAVNLLARREHSRTELARKLARHAEEGDDIERLLDELASRKLLSDERYAEARAHTLAQKYGAARIVHELRMQGVDDSVVQRVASEVRASETDRARDAWRKRFGTLPATAQERAKQMRFLASRGFGGETIRAVLRDAGEEG